MKIFEVERTTEQTTIAHKNEYKALTVENVEGKIEGKQLNIPLGDWNNITEQPYGVSATDSNIKNLTLSSDLKGVEMYCWIDEEGYARVATIPNTNPLYDINNLYRLYWAIDTEILYLNMADAWHKIGTLDHTKMNNVGTLTHATIEEMLNHHNEGLSVINEKINSFKINNLTGNITVTGKNGINITTNQLGKTIEIENTVNLDDINLTNYYTQDQINNMMTTSFEAVYDSMEQYESKSSAETKYAIKEHKHTATDIEGLDVSVDLSNYYNKQEVDDTLYGINTNVDVANERLNGHDNSLITISDRVDSINSRVEILESNQPVVKQYKSVEADVYVVKNNYRDGMYDLTLDGCTANIITDAVRTSQPLLIGNYVSERGVLKQLNNTMGNYIVGYFKDRKFDMNIVDEVVIEMRKKITDINDASNRMVNTFFLQKVDENLPEDKTNGLVFQYLDNEFVIASIWNGGAMSNYPSVQVGNVEIKPDVFYDYKIVIKKDVGFEFYINDTLIGSLADSTNRQYYLSLCGFNSRQEYSRIAYSNGGFVSEIEIPSTVIPMSDTIDVEIEERIYSDDSAYDESSKYCQLGKFLGSNDTISPSTDVGCKCFTVPIAIDTPSKIITIEFTSPITFYRVGYSGEDSMPTASYRKLGEGTVSNTTTQDVLVMSNYKWLCIYAKAEQEFPNIKIKGVPTAVPVAKLPNWIPSYEKLREETFQSVSSGKTLLETAITDKGGMVSKVGEVATFEELSNGIKSIVGEAQSESDIRGKKMLLDVMLGAKPELEEKLSIKSPLEQYAYELMMIIGYNLRFKEKINKINLEQIKVKNLVSKITLNQEKPRFIQKSITTISNKVFTTKEVNDCTIKINTIQAINKII